MNELKKEEKFDLMIMIMKDLRGDWSHGFESRANKIREFAVELGYDKTVRLVDSYIEGINEHGDPDGRHFRTSWEMFGGYEGAPSMLKDVDSFRKVFLKAIINNCNYPENCITEIVEGQE